MDVVYFILQMEVSMRVNFAKESAGVWVCTRVKMVTMVCCTMGSGVIIFVLVKDFGEMVLAIATTVIGTGTCVMVAVYITAPMVTCTMVSGRTTYQKGEVLLSIQ